MDPVADSPQGSVTIIPALQSIRLDMLESSERFKELDKYESYFRCRQYESRRYDWQGRMRGYGDQADISPGWYVPLKQRKPSTQRNLPRKITRSFTSFTFGGDLFPQLVVDDDEDAQDWLRVVAQISGVKAKLQEARDLGGATGAVAMSFAVIEGRVRFAVHNCKHLTVLRWADREAFKIGAVLEAYSYPQRVWDANTGKPKDVRMYFARYWDEQIEISWDPIPEALARSTWATTGQRREVVHGLGYCPVYWTQNLPDSTSEVGESDYDGLLDDFDEINILKSATVRGAVSNMDPTLVLKMEQKNNQGPIRKGSGNVIYSPGGGEYLELEGKAVEVGLKLETELAQQVEETCGVVTADPHEIAAKAQSAAAMRMVYLPMLNQCSRYRDRYGDNLLVPLMIGVLKAARILASRPVGAPQELADGRVVQPYGAIILPDRVDKAGETITRKPRNPGASESVTLNWPPYFPNTWTDVAQAVTAIGAASGNKALISQKTAVENAATLFGVADVQAELDQIEDDADAAATRMAETMGGLAGDNPADDSKVGDEGKGFTGARGKEPKEPK